MRLRCRISCSIDCGPGPCRQRLPVAEKDYLVLRRQFMVAGADRRRVIVQKSITKSDQGMFQLFHPQEQLHSPQPALEKHFGGPPSSTATRLVTVVMLISRTMRQMTMRSASATTAPHAATSVPNATC